MKSIFFGIFFIASLMIGGATFASASSYVLGKSGHVKVRLLSELDQIGPDSSEVLVGLEFKLDPGWHVYWKNPGDVGFPPKLHWQLPDGWQAGSVEFPLPEYFPAPGDVKASSFGYRNKVIYPLYLHGPPQLSKDFSAIAQLDYLVCEETCIPEKAEFKLQLPLGEELKSDQSQSLVEAYSKIPQANSSLKAKWISENEIEVLGGSVGEDTEFFIYSPNQHGVFWKTKKLELKKAILNIQSQSPLGKLELTLGNKNSDLGSKIEVLPQTEMNYGGFLLGLLFAFVGGAILNLMPCVLPVLFLKANSLIKIRTSSQKIHHSLLQSIAGILTSFAILAGVVVLLKALGKQVGWGFQFQSPGFLIFMIILLIGFGLNMLGLFEFQLPTRLNNQLAKKNGAFFEGIFATLLATPCSAPFLGTALSFAFSQTALILFLFFIVMGLGFSLPYFIFLISPKLVLLLPRPGSWMIHLKRFLGIALFGTAAWLGFIVYQQIGPPSKMKDYSMEFSESKIEELVQENPAVFVNITADWCVTCKWNEARVLHTDKFMNLLKEHHIKFVSFDWTSRNENIGNYLEKNGRAGIPFSMLIDKKVQFVFPELLNFSEVQARITEWANKKEIVQPKQK